MTSDMDDKQVMIVVPSSVLDDLTRSLDIAVDSMTPLANAAPISQEAQLSLAVIGWIALNQAKTAVAEMSKQKVDVLPN